MKTVSVVSNFKPPLSLSSFTCSRFDFVLFCFVLFCFVFVLFCFVLFCFVLFWGGGEGSHVKTITINLLF